MGRLVSLAPLDSDLSRMEAGCTAARDTNAEEFSWVSYDVKTADVNSRITMTLFKNFLCLSLLGTFSRYLHEARLPLCLLETITFASHRHNVHNTAFLEAAMQLARRQNKTLQATDRSNSCILLFLSIIIGREEVVAFFYTRLNE